MTTDANDKQEHAGDAIHERIDRAAERAKQGASGVAQGAKDAADRAEAGAHRASDAGAQGAHRAADRVADWRECGGAAMDSARARAADLLDTAREFVRERPVQSVVIALAAGWLVGRLLGRHH